MSIGMNVVFLIFFFFNDTATTEIYTLSLHDALPIFVFQAYFPWKQIAFLPLKFLYFYFVFPNLLLKIVPVLFAQFFSFLLDRKSTRLNSSHANISYAVFCLKKHHLVLIPVVQLATGLLVPQT